jgi:hypothetical protein
MDSRGTHTYTEVTENGPHTIIKNRKEKTCKLIDVTIPADRNIIKGGSNMTGAICV